MAMSQKCPSYKGYRGLDMLQSLHIKGFKCFKDLQLTDISRVTLVSGKNNIGKTSLLESIFLFYNTADPAMFFRPLELRGIKLSFTDAESLFASLFADFNVDNSISIELADGTYTAKMSISINPTNVQKAVSADIPNTGDTTTPAKTDVTTATSYSLNIHYEVSSGSQEDVTIVVRQTPNNIQFYLEPHPVTIIPAEMQHRVVFCPLHKGMDYAAEAKLLNQTDIKSNMNRIVSFLQVVEPKLRGLTPIAVHPQASNIYADLQGTNRKVPLAFLGSGISRLLSIILAIATANNGIVLIDEIDIGIHRSIITKVWEGIFRAAQDFNCQIIATTQSYECLIAACEGASQAQAEDDLCYIRVENYKNNIVTKHYPFEILGTALGHNWEVR
jgi:AAA15 family ATPase/GTPase